MNGIREHWNRFTSDSAFRQRVLLFVGFCIVLVAELFLLRIDLPPYKAILLHSAVAAAVILLPFTLVAVAARLPAGRLLVSRRSSRRSSNLSST